MLIAEVSRFGGPEVLTACEVPDPAAGPGQAVVRTARPDRKTSGRARKTSRSPGVSSRGVSGLHNGGVNEPEISIRPVSDADRPMLGWLVAELWGSEIVAVHGTSFRPAELPGFIAERTRRITGLLTYQVLEGMLEIVTLNAIDRRAGIGTQLIEAAVGKAAAVRLP